MGVFFGIVLTLNAADVTEPGRLFHTRAAATEKARSPTVERRVGGTTRASVVADRSRRSNFTFL